MKRLDSQLKYALKPSNFVNSIYVSTLKNKIVADDFHSFKQLGFAAK